MTCDIEKLIKEAKSTPQNPSQIVQMYLDFEERGEGCFTDWLQQFSFSSELEIVRAVNHFAYCLIADNYMSNKYVQENRVHCRVLWKRFNDLLTHGDKMEKFAKDVAARLWNGYFSRAILDKRVAELFSKVPNEERFLASWEKIANTYALTHEEMHKIWFFVEQVKAGPAFPNSLRRMLYLWGSAKMTGKTTTANTICCLLNGDTNPVQDEWKYQTRLVDEMQIGEFKVPKISSCNVCVMDECFYSDMGKTYADFKRFLTSSNGKARLPYGQAFEWIGVPNYIATSNDSLQKFIKDWDDRRYLAVEFRNAPAVQLSFDEIRDMWMEFITNSTPASGYTWKEWADAIAACSNEKGERTEFADEFENELRQNDFLQVILGRPFNSSSPTNNTNRITLKFFVDYFADHNQEARKKRSEIEAAVIRVFGPRQYDKYWLLCELRTTAMEIQKENQSGEIENDAKF